MNITDIRVKAVNSHSNVKANVSITFDDCFVIHDIKIIEGKNGLFIGMPSRRLGSGEFKNIAHPISSEFRDEVTKSVLVEYEKLVIR